LGGNCHLVPAISSTTKAIFLPQSKVLLKKARDDNRPQTSKHYWSDSAKFTLPLHSKYDKKKTCVKSRSIVNALLTRDVEAEAGSGSGPVSVEAEARKSYRFRFHIGYLTWRLTWRKSFVHFPMWI